MCSWGLYKEFWVRSSQTRTLGVGWGGLPNFFLLLKSLHICWLVLFGKRDLF